MIIVKLMGGLGNQMFQYAAGKALAEKHNVPLKFDVNYLNNRSHRENFTFRDYELNCFGLLADFASSAELDRYKPPRGIKRFFRRLSNIPIYYCEKSFHYDKQFGHSPSRVYLEGYWQTEKYFSHIRPILLNDFHWNAPLDAINSITAESIRNSNSVSLHIRRGDFAENEDINNFHGICSMDYYKNAIAHMNSYLENPTFYIFSDQIHLIKQELSGLPRIKFIEHNKDSESYRDMQLMSYCRHNIIANSSFSWWGAWLNNNQNKIVIAPEKWFADSEINTSDVIPDKWIRMS